MGPNRSVDELVLAFDQLARDCEQRTNPDDVADRFEAAYQLMVEARAIGFGGDTFATMLRDANEPPTTALSLRDVEASLGDNSLWFQTRLYALIQLEAWESAAMMLAPVEGRTGPGYFGGAKACQYYRLVMTTHGYRDGVYQGGPVCAIYHPLSSGGHPKVEAVAPLPGLAMLAAILKAHAEWPALWSLQP